MKAYGKKSKYFQGQRMTKAERRYTKKAERKAGKISVGEVRNLQATELDDDLTILTEELLLKMERMFGGTITHYH